MFSAIELADIKRHYRQNPLQPSCLTLVQYNSTIRGITMVIKNLVSNTSTSLTTQLLDLHFIFYHYSLHNKYLFTDVINHVLFDLNIHEAEHLQILLDNSTFIK